MIRSRKRSSADARASESGQATVEYAIVLTGVLALVLGLGVVHSFLQDGALVTHALQSSSHGIENVCAGSAKDVLDV